jgi:hypothetical protein
MLKIALVFNYEGYLHDNIFTGESDNVAFHYVNHHLQNFFEILKDEIGRRGDEIHTFDYYESVSPADVYLFIDYPIRPLITNFHKRLKFYHTQMKILKTPGIQKKILLMWESPAHNRRNFNINTHKFFHTILSYKKYHEEKYVYFPYFVPEITQELSINSIDEKTFQNKKLSCMIAGNKATRRNNSGYVKRYEIIDYFDDKPDDFDLYGVGWEKPVGTRQIIKGIYYGKKYVKSVPKCFKGMVASKIATYNNYKFAFAIENELDCKGYVTEKIFDVLLSDAVPIYNGENIYDGEISRGAFIDINDFSNMQNLYNFLRNMSFEEYKKFYDAKIDYLQSENFKRFTYAYSIEKLVQILYS